MNYLISILKYGLLLSSPALIYILLLVLSMPIPLSNQAIIFPIAPLMIIYYWSIFRPQLLPNWLVLLLGCIYDLFYGKILGLTGLSNMIYRHLIISQRRLFINQPFMVIWGGFILFFLLDSLIKSMIYCYLTKHNLFNLELVMYFLLNSFIYVSIHFILNKIYLRLPKHNLHE